MADMIELPILLIECDELSESLEDMGIDVEQKEIDDKMTLRKDRVEALHSFTDTETKILLMSGISFIVNLPYEQLKKLLKEG